MPSSHTYDDVCGPFYDTAGPAQWLGISHQSVYRRTAQRALLACPVRDSVNVYPTWQFLPNGAAIPALAEVLAVLATGTDDSWMMALWMQAPSELLDGHRASSWLRTGGHRQRVLTMARDISTRWKS